MRKAFVIVCARAIVLVALVAGSSQTAVASGLVNRPIMTNRKVAIGPEVLYAVRVDADSGVDPAEVATVVDQTLRDPRSWQPIKRTIFTVTTWSKARLRIRIRSPKNTDRSCAPFKTAGFKSCSRNWEVFLNSDRWLGGAAPSQMSVDEYRRYMVNHEVGHSLGEGHQRCPRPGAVAPVMLQQTIALNGCLPNPWPNPLAVAVAVPAG
jgi:Protein of unknown function (DUF3152)